MKTIRTTVAAMMMVFALAASGQTPVEPSEDEALTKKVATELARRDRFHGVDLNTDDGIVTLTGNVDLYVDKMDAEKSARKVQNVDAIRNHIEVSSHGGTDTELRETLANRLRYDRVGYGIVFNSLTVDVKDGRVTVGGNVRDYPDRNSALGIVGTTPGVRDVVDEIQVAPLSASDDALRIRLARAIYGHMGMDKYAMDPQAPIRIIVENGRVSLNGVVLNDTDRQLAHVRANSVPGVFSVTNNLSIAQ